MIKKQAMLKRGFIKILRSFLVMLSCLLLLLNIFSLISGLRVFDSELLPVIIFSTLNLVLLFVYKVLGKVNREFFNIPENRIIMILSKIGFGGNIALFIFSILIIIGFGIIP